MCNRQRDRTDDSQRSVGNQPIEIVGNRSANGQHHQADQSHDDHACMTVSAIAKVKGNDADRYDHHEKFCMQMVVAELAEKRQDSHSKG